jgi:ATP-binding cassette subfamily C protein LapB
MSGAQENAETESGAPPGDGPANRLIDQVRAAAPGLSALSADTEAPLQDEAVAARDSLVPALCALARHHGKPVSEAALTHGLALEGGRLPRESMEDAAERAGLATEPYLKAPTALADHELPVLLLPRNGGAEILWQFFRSETGQPVKARVSAPGFSDQVVEIDAADLTSSVGDVIAVRPRSAMDERGRGAIAGPKKNWFFAAFRDSRHIYAEAIAATLAINVLALAMPLFSMNIYDRVLPNAAEATLWALAIGVMIAIAFDFFIRTLRGHFIDAASRKADVKLSALIYGRLLGARQSGAAASSGVRANTLREFETLREFLNSATLAAFGDLPFMVLFLAVIWVVAGPVAFVVAAAIPVLLLAGWLTQRRLHALVVASFQETAQKNAVAVETLVGLETIKAAGAESWAARKWEAAVAEHIRTGLKIRHVSNLGQHTIQAVQTFVQVGVVIYGFYLVSAGDMTMGALIAATILSGRALAPLAQSAMLLARYNQARIAYQSLSEIVASEQDRTPGTTYLDKTTFDGRVTFQGVDFSYSEEAAPALRTFNLTVAAGEHVGILGGIGSGKSTALKLVQGLVQPTAGRVLVDDVAVSQIEPALLRANVGLLLQGAELFHGTLRDNITMGAPGASDADILEAARVAGALAWVAQLPHGFDTLIRERGSGLSGGQRQSIALARVLIRKPKIVLLDEPTSDLDGRTEHHVIQSLRRALAGRTVIVVTHRPAVLDLVDRVVVLDGGVKREDGPKDVVLERLRRQAAEQKAGGAATKGQETDDGIGPPVRRVAVKPGSIDITRRGGGGTS